MLAKNNQNKQINKTSVVGGGGGEVNREQNN